MILTLKLTHFDKYYSYPNAYFSRRVTNEQAPTKLSNIYIGCVGKVSYHSELVGLHV